MEEACRLDSRMHVPYRTQGAPDWGRAGETQHQGARAHSHTRFMTGLRATHMRRPPVAQGQAGSAGTGRKTGELHLGSVAYPAVQLARKTMEGVTVLRWQPHVGVSFQCLQARRHCFIGQAQTAPTTKIFMHCCLLQLLRSPCGEPCIARAICAALQGRGGNVPR